jgi:hypothetical protein
MAKLPYKERGFHEVEIKERWGKIKTLRVPFELTLEEVERLLELNERLEETLKITVDDENHVEVTKGLDRVHKLLLNQCLIILQHYQPDITYDYLKKHLTETDARELSGFFENNRYFEQLGGNAQVKKKDNKLIELRRMVVFMVRNNFSLLELRKLYLDEFFSYYNELVYHMEQAKELPENSYEKVLGIDNSAQRIEDFFNKM